jgi:hypothetical protein
MLTDMKITRQQRNTFLGAIKEKTPKFYKKLGLYHSKMSEIKISAQV